MRCAAEAVARVARFTHHPVQTNHRTRAAHPSLSASASTEGPGGTMLLLGLTGSIGMGKSAVSSMLTSKLGVPVLDSDAVVHELYSPGGAAVEPVGALFPGVVTPEGGISRPELSKFVLGPTNETNMAALRSIVDDASVSTDMERAMLRARLKSKLQRLVPYSEIFCAYIPVISNFLKPHRLILISATEFSNFPN